MEDEAKWKAFSGRDPAAEGEFYAAVRTTSVYYRPTCPSKRPRQENVEFFSTPDAAEEAGYRPCLRCRPREAGDPQRVWVRKACDYIRRNPKRPATLNELAVDVGVSASHLQRTFKKVMGISPCQYRKACRVELVKAGLRSGETVRNAVHNSGYRSTSWIYSGASKLGMTPSTYKQHGQRTKITFRVAESCLGKVLVARTPRGVCYLGLADTDGELEDALRKEYSAAELIRDYGKPDKWTREVLEYLEGRLARLDDIPVEVNGTSFQAGVWSVLRSIPRGSTRTYQEVVHSIGRPAAARAVGRACATNPVSLLIPCHRVVGKSGAITGYAWGVERKKAILKTKGIKFNDENLRTP